MRLLRVIGATIVGVTLLAAHAMAAVDAAAVRTMMEKSGLVAQYGDLGASSATRLLKSPPPNCRPASCR